MMIHAWISPELAYRLGFTLMHSLWEGTAAAAILMLVLRGIPRRAAQARYLTLVVAMLAVLGGFVVTFAVGPVNLPFQETRFAQVSSTDMSAAPISTSLPKSGSAAARTPLTAATFRVNDPKATYLGLAKSWLESMSPAIATFWMAGAILLGVWRAAGWVGAQRLRGFKTEAPSSELVLIARRIADRIHLSRSFEILVSHFATTPMVIGWLRPVILIPASALTGLTPAQLEGILAHELAHIRRHDYLLNLLQLLAETLLFYHPAVWWISRQIRLEREQACDDVAVSLCENRCEYAQSLAALEELRLFPLPALAATGSGGRQMVQRIRRILAADDAPRWGSRSIFSFLSVSMLTVALFGQAASLHLFSLHNDAPRCSPFTAVRWHGDTPEVQYKGAWYELDAIDDYPVSSIMAYLTQSKDFAPQKHFAEDLVEVMRDMGHQPGGTVELNMKTLDTHQAVIIPDAPMTEENRNAVWAYGNPRGAAAIASAGVAAIAMWPGDRGMPFSAIRWHDLAPEAYVNGKWYELVALNDLPAAKVVTFAQGWSASGDWRRRFAEDLSNILAALNQPTDSVSLTLRNPETHEVSTLKNVPMEADFRTQNMFGLSIKSPDIRDLLAKGTVTLFSAMRWQDDNAQVQVNGNDTWYAFLGADDLTAGEVFSFAKGHYGDDWKKHVAESSVDLLSSMGHRGTGGSDVLLQLQTLDTDEKVTLLKRIWPAQAPVQSRATHFLRDLLRAIW